MATPSSILAWRILWTEELHKQTDYSDIYQESQNINLNTYENLKYIKKVKKIYKSGFGKNCVSI